VRSKGERSARRERESIVDGGGRERWVRRKRYAEDRVEDPTSVADLSLGGERKREREAWKGEKLKDEKGRRFSLVVGEGVMLAQTRSSSVGIRCAREWKRERERESLGRRKSRSCGSTFGHSTEKSLDETRSLPLLPLSIKLGAACRGCQVDGEDLEGVPSRPSCKLRREKSASKEREKTAGDWLTQCRQEDDEQRGGRRCFVAFWQELYADRLRVGLGSPFEVPAVLLLVVGPYKRDREQQWVCGVTLVLSDEFRGFRWCVRGEEGRS
jgi:hypothetical protein